MGLRPVRLLSLHECGLVVRIRLGGKVSRDARLRRVPGETSGISKYVIAGDQSFFHCDRLIEVFVLAGKNHLTLLEEPDGLKMI